MIKRTIILVNILLLSLFFSQTLSSLEFMDIFTYMKKNNMKDKSNVATVMQKCSGVYMAYGKHLSPDMNKQRRIFGKTAAEFILRATSILLDRGQNHSDEIIKQNKQAMLSYTKHYYKKLEKDHLSSGSIFSGDTVKEMALCKELMPILKIK